MDDAEVGSYAAWPVPPGDRVAFLADASTRVERRLVTDWILRHRPFTTSDDDVIVLGVATRDRKATGPALESLLDGETDDVWLAPITVIWTPKSRDGRREARLTDLFLLTNPRDPGSIHQAIIDRVAPRRRAVVAADPARIRELRARWERLGAHETGPDETGASSFTRFVARQAALSLGRAETRVIGARYKIAHVVREEMESMGSWRRGIAALAERLDRPLDDTRTEAEGYLKEMVASASPTMFDLQADLIRRLYTQAYEREIRHDPAQVEWVRALARAHPLVFVMTHKTYLDGAITPMFLHEHGIPQGYGMGGINLDLPVFGAIFRHAGAVFIRRGVHDNPVYRFVLREYVGYLAEKRFNLYWSPEGTRSRTGKLAPMKLGLLSYVVGAYLDGRTDDFVIVPLSFAFDELYEVAEFARYARGARKQPESLTWLIHYVRAQRTKFGRVYVNIAGPISLREYLGPPDPGLPHDDPRFTNGVERLAFEIATRMNAVVPITPIAVLSAALLTMPGPARTMDEIEPTVAELIDDIERRGLPLTSEFDLDSRTGLDAALRTLARHGVVTAFEGGTEPVFAIEPNAALEAAFYRNTIVHYFVSPAVAQLALRASDGDAGEDAVERVLREADVLRALLRHEFYLPDVATFRAEIDEELRLVDADWRSRLRSGSTTARELAAALHPRQAPDLVGPLFEGYAIYADVLSAATIDAPIDDSIVDRAVNVGIQHRMQGRLRWPESASRLIIENAHGLATDRRLRERDEPDVATRRAAFADELRAVLRRFDEQRESNPIAR